DTFIGSFSTTGEGWKLVRRQRRRSFHHGDAVLHRLLHLLEGTHAYLAHALARDAALSRQIPGGQRGAGDPPRLEDAPPSIVEHRQRFPQRLSAIAGFLTLDEPRLLI